MQIQPSVSKPSIFFRVRRPVPAWLRWVMQSLSITLGDRSNLPFLPVLGFYLGGVSGGQYVQFNSNGAGTAYQVIQTGLTGATLNRDSHRIKRRDFCFSGRAGRIYNGTMFGLVNGNPARSLTTPSMPARAMWFMLMNGM